MHSVKCNKAELLFQLKWTEVVQDCSQAVEMNPRYVKALFRRAKALEKLDNKKECLEGQTLFHIRIDFFQHFFAVNVQFLQTVNPDSLYFLNKMFFLCVQMSQRCVSSRPSRTSRVCCLPIRC